MVTDFLTNRLAAVAPSRLSLLRLQPSRVFLAYAISAFTHAVVLGGLAVWMPGDYEDGSFSMLSGNGGIGNPVTPIGSEGGATTSEVFYIEMPTISNAAEAVDYQAPNFSELAAKERESLVTAEIPMVSAVTITRQTQAEQFVAAAVQSTAIEEPTSPAELPSSEFERKQERSMPEPTEPLETPAATPVARNIAATPTVTGAAIVADLAESAQEGEATTEISAVTIAKITRQEQADPVAATATPPTPIEPVETRSKPAEIEIERKQEPAAPNSEPTEPEENPEKLPVVRSIAAAPTVGEVEVELPAVQVSNGRGQEGLGTGNTEGRGNGGASGKVGGDFDSLARGGPLNLSPTYPPQALAAGIEGVVYVRFEIAVDGSAKSATIEKSSGWAILDDAVRAAVKSWRFEPARRGGVPVECVIRVPFDFFLRRR